MTRRGDSMMRRVMSVGTMPAKGDGPAFRLERLECGHESWFVPSVLRRPVKLGDKRWCDQCDREQSNGGGR